VKESRNSPASNRISMPFEQAIDVLLSVDPKKLPPAVRPATPKGKKKRAKSKKKG
jgi:hypothetical protein